MSVNVAIAGATGAVGQEFLNVLEERIGGLYELVEDLAADQLEALLLRVHTIPAVRVAPNTDSPIVRSSIEQLVREAEEGRRALRL